MRTRWKRKAGHAATYYEDKTQDFMRLFNLKVLQRAQCAVIKM